MQRLCFLTALALAVLTTASTPSVVTAQEPCGVEGSVQNCRISTPGGGNASGRTGSDGQGNPVYEWRRINLGRNGNVTSGGDGCPWAYDEPTGEMIFGVVFRFEIIKIATGELIWESTRCIYHDDEIPDPPPPPPTPAEIMQAKPIPAIEPQLMPPPAGTSINGGTSFGALVNRSMWGWCELPGPVNINLTLRGWRVESRIDPVRLTWATNGGSGDTTMTAGKACGTEPARGSNGKGSAWSWIPHKKGDYTVSLTAVWTGDATLSYDGRATTTFSLGEHEFTDSVDQTVVEMQALNN